MFASQSNFELSINVLSPALRVHEGLVLLEKYRTMNVLPYPLRQGSCTSTDMCFLNRSIFCRILLYFGDIQALSAFAQLNIPLRRMVHEEQPMWKHTIRYVGCDLQLPITSSSSAAAILRQLDSNLRASSWLHFCSANRVQHESPQSFQDYVVLGQAQGKTCKSIDTDIHRTLGQSRSILHSNHRLENSETNRAMLSAILTGIQIHVFMYSDIQIFIFIDIYNSHGRPFSRSRLLSRYGSHRCVLASTLVAYGRYLLDVCLAF